MSSPPLGIEPARTARRTASALVADIGACMADRASPDRTGAGKVVVDMRCIVRGLRITAVPRSGARAVAALVSTVKRSLERVGEIAPHGARASSGP